MEITLDQQYNVGEKPTVRTVQYHRNIDMISSSTYQNTPRPSGHKKHLGGIRGYKYITSLWYLNGYGDNIGSLLLFKKNLNASKPSEHPPSGGKMSKGLGVNIGCRDKTSSWYQTGSPI